MFSIDERGSLRRRIIDRAMDDPQVSACALLGSGARGDEDAWSDIDLALQLEEGPDLEVAADRWTTWLGTIAAVADTLTIRASGALYRVFLLSNSMQVDLSFWPHETLRSTGGAIRPIFGTIRVSDVRPADAQAYVRMGWLYALHARSAIARGHSWQADMMLAELRNQIIALACHRTGLDPAEGRDAHRLSAELSARLLAARASNLDAYEQARSLQDTLALYRQEAAHHRAISSSFSDALEALT